MGFLDRRGAGSLEFSFERVFNVRTTMEKLLLIILTGILTCISVATSNIECNEAICASIVSKCTLLKSCECEIEPTGCTCCKKCFACLDYLQAECCGCVGLCPSNRNSTNNNPNQKSVVAKISTFDPTYDPQLWDALMEGKYHGILT